MQVSAKNKTLRLVATTVNMLTRVSLLLFISFQSQAVLCGPPQKVADVRPGSVVYKVKPSGKIELGDVVSKVQSSEKTSKLPYINVHFFVVETLRGLKQKEITARYFLNPSFIGVSADPPRDVQQTYLVSFLKTDQQNGTSETPFIWGPCDMQLSLSKAE